MKNRIAKLFHLFGIYKVVKFLNRNKVKIIMYHRVDDNNLEILLPYSSLAVSVENFYKQMRFLKKNYNVINFDQIKNAPPYSVIITFDDGFLDNYVNAYPILKHYDFPATIFVTTDYVDGKIGWLHKYNYCLNKVGLSEMVQCFCSTVGKSIKVSDYITTCEEMQYYLMYRCSKKRREEVVNKFLAHFKLGLPKNQFMNWQQLQEMSRNNITIGSHTVTHPVLAMLDDDELEYELVISKQKIKEKLGNTDLVSYPWGDRKSINENVSKVASRHYKYGVTTIPNLRTRRLLMPRIGVPNKNHYIFGIYLELVNVIRRFRK